LVKAGKVLILIGNDMRKPYRLINLYVALALVVLPLFTLVRTAEADPAPLAAYSFDRDSAGAGQNGAVQDDSGNGHDGTIKSGWSTNITHPGDVADANMVTAHGDGLKNNSSSAWLSASSNAALRPSGAVTLMAWVQGTNGFGRAAIAMPRTSTDDTTAWSLWTGLAVSGNKYGARITTSGSGGVTLNSGISSDALWHHLALTYDGTTADLYVDGALTASAPATGTLDYGTADQPLVFWNSSVLHDVSSWTGQMDDVRVYGSALSQTQIQSLMTTPVYPLGGGSNYSRSLTMSSSAPNATNVTYHVTFTVATPYLLSALVVDFCSNSPIVGDDCFGPTGMSASGSSTVSNFTIGGTPISGWTVGSVAGDDTLLYQAASSASGTNVVPGTVIAFDITGITNPSTVGSFYARIFTYAAQSPQYTDTSPDDYKESGGLALSTVGGIGLSFQVPESLTFCVYKSSCGDNPTVILGHNSPSRLDSTAVDTDNVKFAVSTNAQTGVVVNAKGDTLKAGTNQIPPIDGGSGAANKSMTPGTAAFGMDIPSSDAAYTVPACLQGNGTATGFYCFNIAGITSAFGSGIISGTGPLNNAQATLTFAATAAPDTPAGEYSATISLVAVATF
jgi:hypothetical protein